MGKKDHKVASSLFRWVFKYKFIMTMIIGVLILVFSDGIAGTFFGKPEAGFVVFFSGGVLIFMSFFEFLKSLFLGLKNFKVSGLMQILENVVKFVVVMGFVLLGMSISGVLWGLIISYVVLTALCVFVVYKKYGFLISGPGSGIDKKSLTYFSIWVFIGSIVNTFYGFADQLVVSTLLSVESLGFYKIAQSWMWAVIYMVPIASQVIYPYFSGSEDKKQLKLMLMNSVKYSAIFVFPLALIMSVFAQPLITFLYKEAYVSSVEPLTILSVASIFMVFSMLLTSFFTGIEKPSIPTKIMVVLIFLYFPISYVLTMLYGILGASIALLAIKIIETFALAFVAYSREDFRVSLHMITKPLMSSLIVFLLAVVFLPSVTNYMTFAFYGLVLILVYLSIMLLIGGLKKEEFLHFKKYFVR
jgi:O-antigen/teichoic acid export membrane protein